jgi:hypothetical protein
MPSPELEGRSTSPIRYVVGGLVGATIGYAIPVVLAIVIVRVGNALDWFRDGSFTDLGIAALALVVVGPLCAAVGGVLGVVRAKRRAAIGAG